MKNWKILLPAFLLLAISLVACGGQAGTAAVAESVAPDVMLAELPQDLDVQTVYDIKNHQDVFMLDVREQYEYD